MQKETTTGACYDRARVECKCEWVHEISSGSHKKLHYSMCMVCNRLTDIRCYTLKAKLYWVLRMLGIVKRPSHY